MECSKRSTWKTHFIIKQKYLNDTSINIKIIKQTNRIIVAHTTQEDD